MRRRYVGDYAREIQVGENMQMTGPGEYLELDAESEGANQELIDEGLLIEAPETGGTSTETATTAGTAKSTSKVEEGKEA